MTDVGAVSGDGPSACGETQSNDSREIDFFNPFLFWTNFRLGEAPGSGHGASQPPASPGVRVWPSQRVPKRRRPSRRSTLTRPSARVPAAPCPALVCAGPRSHACPGSLCLAQALRVFVLPSASVTPRGAPAGDFGDGPARRFAARSRGRREVVCSGRAGLWGPRSRRGHGRFHRRDTRQQLSGHKARFVKGALGRGSVTPRSRSSGSFIWVTTGRRFTACTEPYSGVEVGEP